MDNREKVIKGLESVKETLEIERDNQGVTWVANAIALLKAQEPRVMTLEEYRAIAERPLEERVPLWLEWRGGSGRWTIPERAYQGYGVNWRCWTGKPSDAEREAWAAKHPEPVYPTWIDWLMLEGVIPTNYMAANSKDSRVRAGMFYVTSKAFEPISADMAQKLGIEPKEG